MGQIKQRCAWVSGDGLMQAYHDEEWGVAVYDDRLLFEFLILEGAQAGLSWSTILNKRDAYREAFDHFSADKIAVYNKRKTNQLLDNAGIVRNRLKIAATIQNAKIFLEIQKQQGSFASYLWQFVDYKPICNHWENLTDIPTKTEQSDLMAKTLKRDGFKFVGSTICYALMQAVGMVNDHTIDCYRYSQIKKIPFSNKLALKSDFSSPPWGEDVTP